MIQFTQLLGSSDNIRYGVLASSKKRLLEIVSEMVEVNLDEPYEENQQVYRTLDALCDREKIGVTALGGGIAMPHTKIAANKKMCAVFLQLVNPIDYGAYDNQEVDLVFALFIPENQCDIYAPLLPQIAHYLSQKSLLKQLRNAETQDELWCVFQQLDHTIVNQSEHEDE